jgi:hypothetical protein
MGAINVKLHAFRPRGGGLLCYIMSWVGTRADLDMMEKKGNLNFESM